MAILYEAGWTITNTITVGTAFVGWLLFFWERYLRSKESKSRDLTEVLEPFLAAAQLLRLANDTRRTREKLLHSFPHSEKAPEAAQRAIELMDAYSSTIKTAADDVRRFERAIGARAFRFPSRLNRLLKEAMNLLATAGKHVDAGFFVQADLAIAQIRDKYAQIQKYASGVRWDSAFAWRRKTSEELFEKREEARSSRFELTEREMTRILALIQKRWTTQSRNSFVVHPPKKLIDRKSILESDDVVEQLEDSIFSVVFQDGESEMMSFPELMVFVYQLVATQAELMNFQKAAAVMDHKPNDVSVTLQFTVDQIMHPELVKTLLSKIEFSSDPSDEDA